MGKIEMNMLRPRAKKLPEVTEEMWLKVDEDYRNLVEEFINVNSFSEQTKKTIPVSFKAIRIFYVHIYE